MKFLLLLFIFLTSFLYSQTEPCTCPENYYLAQTDDTGWVRYRTNAPDNESYWIDFYNPGYTCDTTPPSLREIRFIPSGSKVNIDGRTISYQCAVNPCQDGEPDQNGECPTPLCPDGQENLGTEEDVNCACTDGYPVYDLVTQGIVECLLPTCLPDNGGGLPLKAENITFAQCSELYNPILGYQMDFQTFGDLTCCYSDSVQDIDDNPCGPNQLLNSDGLCQDIEQDDTNNCPTGFVWSALDDKCVLAPDPDNDTNDQSGNDDGLNSDGTIREDNEDTTYSGGGLEDNTSEKWLLEYNEDEVDDMLEKYSTGVKTQFSDILAEYSKDLFQLYTVSVPVMPTCGCENISYDMTILGKSYSDTIDICSPMNSMFEIVKPILWFFFLIGLLITYFTGRVD